MKLRRLIAAVTMVAVGTVPFVQVVSTAPAAAFTNNAVSFEGHGYGHGRGMGQWGAYGYAKDEGKSYGWIVDHFYGGTYGDTSGNPNIGVQLAAASGGDMIVRSGAAFRVANDSNAGRDYGANTAALVKYIGSNQFRLYEGSGCGGPTWNDTGTVLTGTGTNAITAVPAAPNQGSSPDQNTLIHVCAGGVDRAYRGVVQTKIVNNTQETINGVSLEDYLKGVIPRESPASWGSSGGMEALKAQAVAARSYALSSPGASWTTCDTTSCQVYGGAFLNNVLIEASNTNTAVDDTAGVIRKMNSNNAVARTEFSSSTGGYSVGGTFPAVEDTGDDVGGNPYHTWDADVAVSAVQAAYPSIGALQSIQVTGRNGLGDYGGRVTSVRIIGSNATTTDTGAGLRSKLGLRSDWFKLRNVASGGVNGYWMLGNDGGIFSFGGAPFYGSMGGKPLNSPVLDMETTPGSGGYWEVAGDGGLFSFGNAQFFGSKGGQPLNQPIVGMTSTPDGGGYWLVARDGGIFAYGNAQFFGSKGGQPLNQPVVGMAATATGNGYWLVAADGGIFAYGDAQFMGSTGGTKLNAPIVAMESTPNGGGYWLLGRDGGIFGYGNAGFWGSVPGTGNAISATSIARTATGSGYVITSEQGVVFSYGDAPDFGGMPDVISGYKDRIISLTRF